MQLAAPAAIAGTADTVAFLAARPRLFAEAPGRAVGSVVFAALWTTLAVRCSLERQRPSAATVVLAGTVAAANAAMVAVHVRHRIASPRVFAGAALSVVALADVLRRR